MQSENRLNNIENLVCNPIVNRRSYSVSQKIDAIRAYYEECNKNVEETSKRTGIHSKLIRDWLVQEKSLNNTTNQVVRKRLKGGGRKPALPEIERKVKIE